MDASEPSVDELVALLQARVAQRRAEGEYPADLEERLEAHYRRLVGPGSGVSPQRWAELDARLAALEAPQGERRSRRGRVEDDARGPARAIETLARLTRAVHDDLSQGVTQQLDDLRADLGRIARGARWRGARRSTRGPPHPAGSAGVVRLGRVRTRVSRQRGERARPLPRPRAALRGLRAGARHRIRARRVPRPARGDRCRRERDRGRRRSRARGGGARSRRASRRRGRAPRLCPTRVSVACARCRSSST